MATIKVNGVELPSPTKYDLGYMDIDKSGRNAAGYMVRDRIGTKRKLELEWGLLDGYEISKILKAVKPAYINVEFHDLEQNKSAIGEFYAGDRKASMILFENGVPTTKGLAFNLIER